MTLPWISFRKHAPVPFYPPGSQVSSMRIKYFPDGKDKNVKTLADVRLLDAAHQKKKLEKAAEKKRTPAPKPAASNRFNNFHQRTYDFSEYEKKLLNQ